jgi:hypothetical protein
MTDRPTIIIAVPTAFYDDHKSRDRGETGRRVTARKVELDSVAYDDLLSDARYYSDPYVCRDMGRSGLAASARATVAKLTAVERPDGPTLTEWERAQCAAAVAAALAALPATPATPATTTLAEIRPGATFTPLSGRWANTRMRKDPEQSDAPKGKAWVAPVIPTGRVVDTVLDLTDEVTR